MSAGNISTIDPKDVAKFSAIADEWWDPEGKFKPLHQFNPIRLQFIRDRLCDHFDRDPRSMQPLKGLRVLDVGCGGSLIAEPLARMGAEVTGIDASEKNTVTAQVHAAESGLNIDYKVTTVEELAAVGEIFDAVISLEVVEHVANFELFIKGCADLMGVNSAILIATLNRTPKSFAFGIVGAEYIMRWLPRGTHNWRKFIRPSELASALRRNRVVTEEIAGLSFNPFTNTWRVNDDVSVNYVVFGRK
ncbi:MAG: bifunctional 2-polyprenyl-6-hydroxyphenol methylase/3-demethylubiquinol 3-O-methyltransferase UbiG [Pseudomonadota bacterium]|nr:bifunctional 2-polyprenyl-6-hydroxyphenol methylase/3-demethylubiquinol 3-O-methyltransferase UbiG [Pseudomonadota bacterium]